MFAQLLTMVALVAIGAVVAILALSFLPARRRTMVPLLLIGSATTATVAFGTGLAQTMPERIVATHDAAELLAELHHQLPQLDRLADADPLIEYELLSAFHTAYLADGLPAADRARTAGRSLGLAVQQAFLRNLPHLSDGSAMRLIALEHQALDVRARGGADACGDRAYDPDPAQAAQLHRLRRAVLRAKIEALVETVEDPPTLGLAERSALEARLLAETAPRLAPGSGRCAQLLAFYAVLRQQPADLQGKWVRSRQMLPVEG